MTKSNAGTKPRNQRRILDADGKKVHAAVMFAKGATVREVAQEFGCSPGTAAKYKKDRADLIKACRESLVSHTLPIAVEVRKQLVEEYNDPKRRLKMPIDIRRQAHEHVMATHKAAGVYPDNQTASVVVEELNVDNRKLNVSAVTSDNFMKELRKLIE